MSENEKPKKKKLTKAGRYLLDAVLVISLCTAAFSGWKLYEGLKEYNDSKDSYAKLKETASVKAEKTGSAEEQSEENTVDYAAMKEINPDFGGWISLEDSSIDYPFVYGQDNEYYLYHLFTGEYNRSGCIFIDAQNNRGFEDKVTVFYGHHMRNGTMFADIENYKDPSYYETHKEIRILTEDGEYSAYPVAGFVTNGNVAYIEFDFTDDQAFMDYVNGYIANSDFSSQETVEADDQIVLFSTCSYDVADGRYVLMAKLVRTR
jgi:sortase B